MIMWFERRRTNEPPERTPHFGSDRWWAMQQGFEKAFDRLGKLMRTC